MLNAACTVLVRLAFCCEASCAVAPLVTTPTSSCAWSGLAVRVALPLACTLGTAVWAAIAGQESTKSSNVEYIRNMHQLYRLPQRTGGWPPARTFPGYMGISQQLWPKWAWALPTAVRGHFPFSTTTAISAGVATPAVTPGEDSRTRNAYHRYLTRTPSTFALSRPPRYWLQDKNGPGRSHA